MQTKERAGKRLIVLLVLLFALIPGCGGAYTSSSTNDTGSSGKKMEAHSPVTYTGTDREQKLIEGAKKEGHLSWYTSLAGPVVNAIAGKFSEKYPFIKVEVFRAEETKLVSKMSQEEKARKSTVDVVEMTDAGTLLLRDAGLIRPFYSPSAEKLPPDFRTQAEGKLVWHASDRVSYIGFGYNQKLITDSDAPKTLEDLLKPQFKGKLGLVTSSTGTRWVGLVLHEMGEQKGNEFLKKLAQQDVKIQAVSGSAMMGLIAQGEVAASPAVFKNHAEQQIKKGAPVKWITIGPAIANVGNTLVAKNTPNPHASMLFVDFLLGKDGQQVLNQYEYVTAGEKVAFKYWIPEEKINSSKQYEEQFNKWKNVLKNTFH